MAVTFLTKNTTTPKSRRGHSQALSVTVNLNQPGRLRVGHIMTLFSVSHATVYSHIRKKLIPKPDGKDGMRPFWNTETIREILER